MYLLIKEANRFNKPVKNLARLRRILRAKLRRLGIKTSVETTYQHLIELLNKQ